VQILKIVINQWLMNIWKSRRRTGGVAALAWLAQLEIGTYFTGK
jgi:hypothetical protein